MNYMFSGCDKLQTVTLGEAFGFIGTTEDCYLPAQSATYIAGATGKWYDTTTNIGYTPAELADVTRTEARTYTAIPPTV